MLKIPLPSIWKVELLPNSCFEYMTYSELWHKNIFLLLTCESCLKTSICDFKLYFKNFPLFSLKCIEYWGCKYIYIFFCKILSKIVLRIINVWWRLGIKIQETFCRAMPVFSFITPTEQLFYLNNFYTLRWNCSLRKLLLSKDFR